jgi:tRNA G10  N-methylase Trm11
MQYAFILGRVYTLSLAELFMVLPKLHPHEIKILDASLEVLVIDTPVAMDAEKVQQHLGGTVKILKVIDILKKREQDSVNFTLQNYFKPSTMKKDFLANYSGKVQFGVSVYLLDMDVQAFGEPKRIGMFIKRAMQDGGASIRLVLPEFNALALASVVVTKNLLLEKGAEIDILAGKDRVYTAKTLRVQDFEDYGRRDYQRPVRDEKQGMIPPKVAQIMLNLANVKTGETVLDPFVGIGTLVQEGALMGYRVLGSDINPAAISGSEKNLEWFRNRYKIAKGKYHIEQSDARTVHKLVETLAKIGAYPKISAIVTEGYLGPMYTQFPRRNEIEANFKELETLYTESFQEFLKFLAPQSRVVICLPAYKKSNGEYERFPSLDFITSLGYNAVDLVAPEIAKKFKFLKLTDRGTAIYDRKDQIVAREITIFEKQ